jgi:hypothetical protein
MARVAHRTSVVTAAGALALAAALALSGGCASTSLVNMWKEPTFAGPALRNVFVTSARKDPTRRRIWEDAYVTALSKRGVTATPSYRIFPDAPPSTDDLKRHVSDGDYDGLIVAKRLGRQERQNYVPGYSTIEPVTAFNPWWGTWETVYQEVYTPGYVETETVGRVETLVYALHEAASPGSGTNVDRMVWVGTSETIDPTSAAQMSGEVSDTIVAELSKAKIIP